MERTVAHTGRCLPRLQLEAGLTLDRWHRQQHRLTFAAGKSLLCANTPRSESKRKGNLIVAACRVYLLKLFFFLIKIFCSIHLVTHLCRKHCLDSTTCLHIILLLHCQALSHLVKYNFEFQAHICRIWSRFV